MKYLSKYFIFLLFIIVFKGKSSKKDYFQLKLLHTFNYTYTTYNNSINKSILLENIKYLNNDDNFIFRNFPRRNEDDIIMPTFTKYDVNKKEFIKWPYNNDYNDKPWNDNDCSHFISIIDFEFDENNNIYLLDEGNGSCSINLYVFNLNGSLQHNITIQKRNGNNFLLTNFVLDRINNYVYIPFYNLTDIDEGNISNYRAGIFVNELNTNPKESKQVKKASKIVYLKDQLFIYDEKYNFDNEFIQLYFENFIKKIINVALSCDSQYLILCPLASRMLYSISTDKLRDKYFNYILINDVNEAYKNDASSSIITSNMDNLFMTGLEKNVIYFANQIESDLSMFDFKFLDKKGNENMGWPAKLSITDGTLYILSKKIENNTGNNIMVCNQIFKALIGDDKSYVYKCSGLVYRWNFIAYIIWGIFALIVVFVLTFVYVGNNLDQEINNKKKN